MTVSAKKSQQPSAETQDEFNGDLANRDAVEGDIIILGAGMAGLTTAYALLKSFQGRPEAERQRVIILEKEERPGGLAISLSRDGVVTDLGPHRLHTELPEVKALLAEVAEEHLIHVTRESHIYWEGDRLRYPISPFELLLKKGPFRMAKLGFGGVLAKIPGLGGGKKRPDSFERFMRGQFGGPLWNQLLGPYTEKVWRAPGSEIHGDVARVRVSAGGLASMAKRLLKLGGEKQGQETALKSFRYPKGGLQTLVDILVSKVEELGGVIHCSAPISKIEETGDGEKKAISLIEAADGEYRFENPGAVVSTIPLPTLGVLLDNERLKVKTDKLDYLALLLVVLVINKDRLSRDNWLYFFDGDSPLNRAYEGKNFDPGLAPDGKTVLCCEVTCKHDEDIWLGGHDQLAERVAKAASETGLFSLEELDSSYVYPVKWAYPFYSLNYRDQLEEIFADLGNYSNLLSSGRQGLFNHNNTDHSMSMGMDAAQTILENPANPGPAWFNGVLERFSHFRIVD